MACRKAVELQKIKTARKAGSPEPGSETVTFGASPILVSPLEGIRELSTLWMVWGVPA